MEEWKYIEGTDNVYMVSSFGRVKSVERYIVKKDGYTYHMREKFFKGQNNKGYDYIGIKHNNKVKTFPIHRLVATAFVDNYKNYRCVNHIDGVKLNNHAYNLEWCTHAQNNAHARSTGLYNRKIESYLRGQNHPMAKLDATQVIVIIQCLKEGLTQQRISDYFKVNRSTIGYIKRGKLWATSRAA